MSSTMNALMRDAKDGTLDVSFDEAMYMLRAAAANRKLDMSDAFESYAGPGVMTNMGVMPKLWRLLVIIPALLCC